MPKNFSKRRKKMALDPATAGLVIKGISHIVGRVIDTKDAKSSTNVTTVGGVGLGGAAAYLISSGDPTMSLVGYVLGAASVALTMWKKKEK